MMQPTRTGRALLGAAALAVVVALVAIAVGGAGASDAAKVKQRPNIVVIFTDDQQYQSLKGMPYVSKRKDWVNFSNSMVNTALCCPSRATLLTGQTSSDGGIERNKDAPKFKGRSTVADWLQAGGYRTGFVGKYFNKFPWDEADDYVPDGWDYWVSYSGKQGYRDYTLNENGTLVDRDRPKDYSTDVFTDKTVEFIESAGSEQPFFALVSYFAPHGPWVSPKRHQGVKVKRIPETDAFFERNVRDKPKWIRELPKPTRKLRREFRRKRVEHQRSLLAIDEGVRKIFKTLEAKGELDNTIVIYTTDHGAAMGDHRYTRKNCAYEACSRVPLLIRAPGIDGRRENALVGNIDLAPTFTDYAGIETGEPVNGRSLRPILERERKRIHKSILLRRAHGRSDRSYWGLRTKRFKYVRLKTGERELYDLRSDPYELRNRLGTGRPKWKRKARALDQRLRRVRATKPKIR
jgi:N-acetylglucosamine-6-sulfatase